jgi:hypothetical protein
MPRSKPRSKLYDGWSWKKAPNRLQWPPKPNSYRPSKFRAAYQLAKQKFMTVYEKEKAMHRLGDAARARGDSAKAQRFYTAANKLLNLRNVLEDKLGAAELPVLAERGIKSINKQYKRAALRRPANILSGVRWKARAKGKPSFAGYGSMARSARAKKR